MPEASRPVFDSGHIGSYIYHIPGLSDRFFYSNDDVFFGAPVDPAYWFGRRLAVPVDDVMAPQHELMQPHELPLVNALIFARDRLAVTYLEYRHEH